MRRHSTPADRRTSCRFRVDPTRTETTLNHRNSLNRPHKTQQHHRKHCGLQTLFRNLSFVTQAIDIAIRYGTKTSVFDERNNTTNSKFRDILLCIGRSDVQRELGTAHHRRHRSIQQARNDLRLQKKKIKQTNRELRTRRKKTYLQLQLSSELDCCSKTITTQIN